DPAVPGERPDAIRHQRPGRKGGAPLSQRTAAESGADRQQVGRAVGTRVEIQMSKQAHASRNWTRAVALAGMIAAAAPFPVAAQPQDLASLSLSDLMQIEIAPVFGA